MVHVIEQKGKFYLYQAHMQLMFKPFRMFIYSNYDYILLDYDYE